MTSIKANVAPLKSIEKYFQQNVKLAMKLIRLRHKIANVYATKAAFCRALDDSSVGHMESHVIIRRVDANGCISTWIEKKMNKNRKKTWFCSEYVENETVSGLISSIRVNTEDRDKKMAVMFKM